MYLKNKNSSSFIYILILTTTLLGIGCGQDKKSSSPAPVAPPYYPQQQYACTPGVANCQYPGNVGVPPQSYQYGQGSCAHGQIYTAYNCMPTAGCPANHGMYNNQCIPALTINPNGLPQGYNHLNGYWNHSYNSYYNSYPYSNYGYYNEAYPYSYYNSGYPYNYNNYNSNFGLGFSLWVR